MCPFWIPESIKTIQIQPGAPSGRQGAPEVAQNHIFYGFGHPLDLLWAHFGYNFLRKLSETTATNTRILLEQISTNTLKFVPACCKCVGVFELQKASERSQPATPWHRKAYHLNCHHNSVEAVLCSVCGVCRKRAYMLHASTSNRRGRVLAEGDVDPAAGFAKELFKL